MNLGPDGRSLTLRAPDNWHAHFRDGALLDALVPVFLEAGWRRRIVAEPNTTPPVLTGAQALRYRERIEARAKQADPASTLEVVPTIQITESTTGETVREAVDCGIRVGKVYPFMVTTHSGNGVQDYGKIYPALAVAEDLGMVVQFHGEHPDNEVEGLHKERAFIGILDRILGRFPRLRLTMEHITSRAAVDWVSAQGSNVGASITVHHLLTTIDDVLGYSRRSRGLMRVHCGCKPQPKWRDDRQALIDAIMAGHPRFFYGGDDAAHPRKNKEAAASACGVWNTAAALPLLVGLFEEHGKLEQLEPFVSEFGARFYGYPLSDETVTLVRENWTVPDEVVVPALGDSIVPFWAGDELQWRVVGATGRNGFDGSGAIA